MKFFIMILCALFLVSCQNTLQYDPDNVVERDTLVIHDTIKVRDTPLVYQDPRLPPGVYVSPSCSISIWGESFYGKEYAKFVWKDVRTGKTLQDSGLTNIKEVGGHPIYYVNTTPFSYSLISGKGSMVFDFIMCPSRWVVPEWEGFFQYESFRRIR